MASQDKRTPPRRFNQLLWELAKDVNQLGFEADRSIKHNAAYADVSLSLREAREALERALLSHTEILKGTQ